VEPLGGPREVQLLGDGQEVPQIAQLEPVGRLATRFVRIHKRRL
jgi:hypothetical protein